MWWKKVETRKEVLLRFIRSFLTRMDYDLTMMMYPVYPILKKCIVISLLWYNDTITVVSAYFGDVFVIVWSFDKFANIHHL